MLQQLDAIAFWVVLAIFVWFFYGPWQNFWSAWYRQEVFSARDRLFDMAASGNVSFDDESYRTERKSLDLMIRFADQTTWTQICVAMLLLKSVCGLPRMDMDEMQERSSKKFEKATQPAQRALATILIARAPVLWPVFIIVGLVEFWELAAKGTQNLSFSLMHERLLLASKKATQGFAQV